jgi:NADH-quinone oxidoreductase subunit J
MNIAVWAAGAVAVVSTLLAITRANPVHALLYLIVGMLGVAVVLYAFGAAFAAVLQVIIWAGAIMVLFLFVMMMLSLRAEAPRPLRVKAVIGPALLTAVLFVEVMLIVALAPPDPPTAAAVEPRQVGEALYGPYALGVELASVLLMVGVAGAFHLGRHRRDGEDEGTGEESR